MLNDRWAFKPRRAKTADGRSGVRNGPSWDLNVCDKWPSFSPSAFLKTSIKQYETKKALKCQTALRALVYPKRIIFHTLLSYIIHNTQRQRKAKKQTNKKRSGFSHETKIVFDCHLVSAPGTSTPLLPTLIQQFALKKVLLNIFFKNSIHFTTNRKCNMCTISHQCHCQSNKIYASVRLHLLFWVLKASFQHNWK